MLQTLGLATALGALGCDDAHVHFSSCTSFHNDGTSQQQTTRTVQDCNGTVIIIVHDAPSEELSSFSLTIERLDLVSLGRAYRFFEGARRENLLDYRESGFLLGRRSDVPEVEFDLVRLYLSDVVATSSTAESNLELRDDGLVEVPLDPPLEVWAPFPRRLRIDIDARETLASSEKIPAERRGQDNPILWIEPAVRAYGTGDPLSTVTVAPMRGQVPAVDDAGGRFLFRPDEGGGEYWISFNPGDSSAQAVTWRDREAVRPGATLVLESALEEDGSLRPLVITPTPSEGPP